MRNRDKFLGIIAILAIIGLLFAGCGGSGGDSTTPGGTDDPNTPGGSSGGGGGAYVGGGSKPSTPQNTGTADSVSVAFAQDSINLAADQAPTTVGALVTTTGAALDLVVYSTSDALVADVDTLDGEITAVGPGTATITIQSAWDNTKTDTLTVNVVATPAKPVTAITLDKTGIVRLTAGQKLPVKVTFEPADADHQAVTWVPLPAASAAVEVVNGIVTAVKAGTTTVTATSINGSKTASFDVVVSAAAPTGVSITETGDDLVFWHNASTPALTSAVEPSGAVQDVLWSSASPGVVSFADPADPEFTINGTGTAVITATTVAEPVKTASVTVTINRAITSVTITAVDQDDQPVSDGGTITMEDTLQLSAEVAPTTADGTNSALLAADQTVVWTAVPADAVEISATGDDFVTVTPLKVGDGVKITATSIDTVNASGKAEFTIDIDPVLVTNVNLSAAAPTPDTLVSPVEGMVVALPTVEILPENATNKTYKWESDTPTVIEITGNGTTTAWGAVIAEDANEHASFPGTVTVVLTCTALDASGKTATYTVKVPTVPDPSP